MSFHQTTYQPVLIIKINNSPNFESSLEFSFVEDYLLLIRSLCTVPPIVYFTRDMC